VENTIRDAKEILSGLVDVFPSAVRGATEVYGLSTDIPLLWKYPTTTAESFKDTAGKIKDALIEPYQKHGLKVIYEKPVTTLSDAVAVFGVLGASVRLSGKAAGSSRLMKFGRAIETLPYRAASKAIKKGVKAATGINLEKRAITLGLRARELARIPIREKEIASGLYSDLGKMSERERALFDEVIHRGGTFAQLEANPRVKSAYLAYGDFVSSIREKSLIGRGIRTADELHTVVEKKYAADVFGEITDETIAAAKAEIFRAEVKPIYVPALFDRKGLFATSLEDILLHPEELLRKVAGETGKILAPSVRKGKVSFLEKYTGAKGRITDPRKYVRASVRGFLEMDASLRWVDEILQSKELALGAASEAGKAAKLETMGILQKYFRDPARARAVFVRDLAAKEGGLDKAIRFLSESPETVQAMKSASEVILDPTVKAILDAEFSVIGGKFGRFIRIYDRITNLFRLSATVLNPKWYTGNIVGDAVLSIMAGVTLGDWRFGKRVMDSIPPELRYSGVAIEQAGNFAEAMKLRSPAEFVQQIDDAVRARIVTGDVARRLKATGHEFFGMDDSFEVALREVLSAPETLSNAMSELQILHEKIARGLGGRKVDPSVIADLASEAVKAGQLERAVPRLRRMEEFVRPSIDRSSAFVGNYLGLGPWERKIFRRIVPFYTWVKAMSLLAFRYPFLAPKTAFFWHRYAAVMMDLVGDDELPESMKGYAPVFVREDGSTVWVRMASLSPFGSVGVSRIGDFPVPSALNVFQGNPWLSLALKLEGGKTEWEVGVIPYGGAEDTWVQTGTGDAWKYLGDGRIRKIIPQAPLISSLAHAFPTTRILEEALIPYQAEAGSWQPIRNPDGSIKYPKDYWRFLSAFGLSTRVAKRGELIRREKLETRKYLQSLKTLYRRSDPEERKYILGIFRDYAHYGLRVAAR